MIRASHGLLYLYVVNVVKTHSPKTNYTAAEIYAESRTSVCVARSVLVSTLLHRWTRCCLFSGSIFWICRARTVNMYSTSNWINHRSTVFIALFLATLPIHSHPFSPYLLASARIDNLAFLTIFHRRVQFFSLFYAFHIPSTREIRRQLLFWETRMLRKHYIFAMKASIFVFWGGFVEEKSLPTRHWQLFIDKSPGTKTHAPFVTPPPHSY